MSHLDDLELKAVEEAQAKKLLAKKRLTGAEAGWLYIIDSREHDHGRQDIFSWMAPGFGFTAKDIQDLKSRLKTQADRAQFNSLVDTYSSATFTIHEAKAEAYRIQRDLFAGHLELLAHLSGVAPRDVDWPPEEGDLKTRVQDHHKKIRGRIRHWLAYLLAIEMLSAHLRVKLTEDLEACLASIQETVRYTNALSSLMAVSDETCKVCLPAGVKLPQLRIDDLKPFKWMIRHLRERLAMTLGRGWWTETLEQIRSQTNSNELHAILRDIRTEKKEVPDEE